MWSRYHVVYANLSLCLLICVVCMIVFSILVSNIILLGVSANLFICLCFMLLFTVIGFQGMPPSRP